jgi:hypothetical protein
MKGAVLTAALKKLAKDEVVKLIVAKAPFFAGSIMNPLLGWFVSIVIGVLYDKGALGINWMWISLDNNKELKEALKSKEKLYAILQAGGDHAKAEQEFNKATDDLIRHNINRLYR